MFSCYGRGGDTILQNISDFKETHTTANVVRTQAELKTLVTIGT